MEVDDEISSSCMYKSRSSFSLKESFWGLKLSHLNPLKVAFKKIYFLLLNHVDITLMSCQSGCFPDCGCQIVSLSSFVRMSVVELSDWNLPVWIIHAKQIISIRAVTRRSLSQTVNAFWRGVATSSDTISELTTITDWQLTRRTLWRQGMTVQEVALFVSALAPRNNTEQFCAAVYVMATEPIKCAGNFRATK